MPGNYKKYAAASADAAAKWRLEVDFGGQLNGSPGVEGPGDLAEVARSHRLPWECEIGMVEQVEELAAHLELRVVAVEVPGLAERHIIIDQPTGLQFRRVAHHIPPRSIRRHYECSRIEPLCRGPVADVRAGDLLGEFLLASVDGANILIVT